MTLHVHQISAMFFAGRVPEVIEAHVIQRGCGGETGNVAAQFGGDLVCAHDHCHGVPAHIGADAVLELVVAGRALLLPRRDGVDVGSAGAVGQVGAGTPRLVDQSFEEIVRALSTLVFEHPVQSIQPLLRLLRIGIWKRRHVHDLAPGKVRPRWGPSWRPRDALVMQARAKPVRTKNYTSEPSPDCRAGEACDVGSHAYFDAAGYAAEQIELVVGPHSRSGAPCDWTAQTAQ